MLSRAKLGSDSTEADISEQQQCLQENRHLTQELTVDTLEVYGCYACLFTATTTQEVGRYGVNSYEKF